jgi:hypothetical protein
MGFTMINNKLLVALSLTAATFLTACGGGEADEFVVRNVFAVGEIVEVTEDDGPLEGEVSSNDAGEGLTYALSAGSTMANGTIVFNVDGSFIYTPNADFFGTDSISYVVTHTASGDTDTALLTINVENDFELLEEYGWGLISSDEFDGATLDEGAWTGVNATLADGKLLLTTEVGITSSLRAVNGIMSGRIEASIQLPAASDLYSVFGLMPIADMYDGENALVMLQGGTSGLVAGAHYGLGLSNGVSANSTVVSGSSSEFHTYAIEWSAEQIRWYFDGVHVHTVDPLNTWAYNLSGDEVVVDNEGPFNQDMQIMLKLDANGGELPAVMMVDYIKIWSCDAAVSPTTPQCGSNVKTKIDKTASDRIESVSTVTTQIYTDALQELSWHYTDEIVELAFGSNNGPIIVEIDTETDRGVVIDVTHPEGDANVSITAPAVELIGRDTFLNFDMYIDSANTTTEILEIRMETGWPYMGVFTWNVADLALDTWVTYKIAVSDFVASPFVAPDWINCCVEGGQEGDLLPLDPTNIGSLLTVEFFGGVHFQMDNIELVCTSNESCIQGPLSVQDEEVAGGSAPIRYEAEEYDAESGTQLEATTDDDGGENVGFIDPGDFLEYTISAPSAGSYTIDYRLASGGGSEGFELSIDGVLVDTQIVPDTGGWQEWTTQSSVEFLLEAGPHALRFDFIGGAINFNWFELFAPVSEILIEAEDFIDSGEIQLEATADEGGGENVGFTDAGDFLEYTVNIPSDGTYTIQYRLAGQNDSDGFETSFNGAVLDTQVMPSTGGWQTWVTQSGEVTLVAGEQTMRIDFIGGQININWIKLIKN